MYGGILVMDDMEAVNTVIGTMTAEEPPLKVVCAWCGLHLSGPENVAEDRISHGICKVCLEEETAYLAAETVEESA
jgi:hypothetical protein